MKNLAEAVNMTLGQIIGGGVGIVIILMTFIEITPIKINPLSWLFGQIGKMTNKELADKVDGLEKKVGGLEVAVEKRSAKDDKQEAINCRRDILAFGDEVRRGVKHSHEHFNQILEDIDGYEKYCDAHPEFENNKTVATKQKIIEVYRDCLDRNDFL